MFACVKPYVPEAIIALQTATFCNRIRGYIRCPQFSFRALQYSSSTVQFSPFPRTFSLLIIILVPVIIQSVILFLQCLIFLCRVCALSALLCLLLLLFSSLQRYVIIMLLFC
jgi:hypothetical protein